MTAPKLPGTKECRCICSCSQASTGAGQPEELSTESQPGGQEHNILVRANSEQLDLWQQAARRDHLTIEAWVAQSLDQAARHTMPGG